jgi:beta-phosphoglucomutase
MLKAVIFDFDGVVINSARYYIKTREDFFKIKFTKKDIKENLATTTKDFLKFVKEKYSISTSFKKYNKEKEEIFLKYLKEIKPNPGVKSLLKELKKKKVKIILSSSNERKYVTFFLTKFKLIDFFDLILCSEDIKKHKPDKEAFYKPLKILNLNPKYCVGIEDSLQGIISINKNNIKSVGLLSEFTTKKDFLNLNTSLIIKSIKELNYNVLNKLIKRDKI